MNNSSHIQPQLENNSKASTEEHHKIKHIFNKRIIDCKVYRPFSTIVPFSVTTRKRTQTNLG